MHELAGRLAARVVEVDRELEQEFEARLAESSTLAFRVAYGVLRHREDAEDVAQEAFAKAYRSFPQLRDRERFRAWLVRMTWRLALTPSLKSFASSSCLPASKDTISPRSRRCSVFRLARSSRACFSPGAG